MRQDLTPFGWEDIGADIAGIAFGSVAIGARLLRFGPMPFCPNRTASFDLSLPQDDLLSSPIGTTKRIADNHVFPADEVGCGIETLRQGVPRRVAVKNNGGRRNRL